MPSKHRGLQVFQEGIEQFQLLAGQPLGYGFGDDIQVGTLPQQPGGGLVILLRSRGKQQATGILVDAEHHQGRLFRCQRHGLLPENPRQDGR